jgi:hypothetical protein
VTISNTGCYPLAGDITRTETSPNGISIALAFVTLEFCNSGRSASIVAISGTLSDTETNNEVTTTCNAEFGMVYPNLTNPSQFHRARYSDLQQDADGFITSGRLFGAIQGSCTSTGGGPNGPVAQVFSLGAGTSVIENGRVIAVDFNAQSSDGEIVFTGLLIPPP